MPHMTKREAVRHFRQHIAPHYTDKPALRQAWNDWTDELAKAGHPRAYNGWSQPAFIK